MNMTKSTLGEIVPLLQALVWPFFILALLFYFKDAIKILRMEIQKRLRSGEGIELGPIKLLERKVEAVELKVDIAKSFVLSMGDDMYKNLKKISSGNFGSYEIDKDSGLWRELYHLRDIGYIEVSAIRSLPKKGANLSQYVIITEVGKKFVELRENYLREDHSS